jgi:hypothetical protein
MVCKVRPALKRHHAEKRGTSFSVFCDCLAHAAIDGVFVELFVHPKPVTLNQELSSSQE